jgi:hypothetical protein
MKYFSLWVGVGTAIGVVLGVATGNMALWLAMGVGIGTALGVATGQLPKQ